MAASTSNYPAPGPGVKIDKVNPLVFGRFEYFPFAPPEIRNMVWELAIPRSKVITVKIVIKSCRTTAGSEQGCQDKHNLPFFTFAAIDDEFGVMMACRESRAFGFRVLPNALPTTYSQPAGIRYNPSISAIKILNFKDLLEEDLEKVVAEIDLSKSYNFNDLDYQGWSMQKAVVHDVGEEVEQHVKIDIGKKRELLILENLMNDRWLGYMDYIDYMGYMDFSYMDDFPVQETRQVKPKIYFSEGTFGNGGVLKSIPPRPAHSRFCFGQLYSLVEEEFTDDSEEESSD
ncbi:hypothetical protein V8E51_010113 [Hyaloscypha variabilis]